MVCFSHLRKFTTVINQWYQLPQTWTYSFEVLRFVMSFWEAPWYSSFILFYIYLYTSTGIRFYIFGLLLDSRIRDRHLLGWVHCIVTMKIFLKISSVLFVFWSYCLEVYIHLRCIHTQQRTTTPFSSWSISSQVSLLSWYYQNTAWRFVWYCLVFIQIVINFIFVYPASTHIDE